MHGPLARALAALWPYLDALPAAEVAAFERRAAIVEAAAVDADVDVATLAAVCWQETRLGAPRRGDISARPYASLCGVRIAHRYVGDDARSAAIAARSLVRHRARCGSWPAAVDLARTYSAALAGEPREWASLSDAEADAWRLVALSARCGCRHVEGA